MKLSLLVATAALGVAALGPVPEARASCETPKVGFLPAPGGTLPPHPTIYVFVPRHHPPGKLVTIEGTEASFEPVATSRAYEVVRVRVAASKPGDEFTVRWRYADIFDSDRGYLARYRIGATPPNRARVVGVTRHLDRWMCSFADAIRLELDGTAIAYRVDWRDGETTIVPADGDALWPAYKDAPAPGTVTATELGHLNCLGYSVDPEALARPRAFDLYALFADGSELRIGSSIAQLGDQGVRLPAELVGEVRDARPYPVSTAMVAEWLPPWWTAAPGALGGAVVLLGGALLGRRRHRDHAPRQ
jgi:hypothetical protein